MCVYLRKHLNKCWCYTPAVCVRGEAVLWICVCPLALRQARPGCGLQNRALSAVSSCTQHAGGAKYLHLDAV